MQLFPVATQNFETTQNAPASPGNGGGFEDVFASYIEEGRYGYTGRPGGFSAYGPESGTIDDQTGSELARQLRKRNVSEEAVERVEALLASGSPATIGTIFNTLSGKGRHTEALGDEEAASFKTLMGKLGFKQEELDELMALSDAGDSSALFSRIAAKLDSLQGDMELTKSDWATLLKGLDASKNTKTGLMAFFSNTDQLTLTGAELKTMLTGYRAELSDREEAARHAQTEMREAMVQALAAAKAKKQGEPVSDSRGSRRSDQSESLMQNSVRKNTGVDEVKRALGSEEGAGTEADARENFGDKNFADESFGNGKSRSERILATSEHTENARGKSAEKSAGQNAEKPQPKIFANVTAAPDMQNAAQNRQSVDTAALARNSRQEIFSQVEQGLLQSAQNGGQRLTLQLNPGELGQVTVVLSVHQGEVKATIRAENQDSADVLRAQLAELRTSLEAEGLKVKELDVQTGLSEQSLADRWDSQEHNLMRDTSERDRLLRLSRIRRETAGGNGGEQHLEQSPGRAEASGLHVVA